MTRRETGNSTSSLPTPLAGLSICFDLDGTLVDTAPDLVRVTNEVIALEGLPATNYGLARAAVSLGSRRLITDALDRAGHGVDTARLDVLQREFLSRYAEDIARLSRPYPGVCATLDELDRMGARLSVCTNKPGWLARPLLDALGMTARFDRIVGGDEVPASKPDPSHIFTSAGHRRAERIVMVGDSWPDMEGARRARCHGVLVTYGYSYRPQIRLRADTRLRNFRDLAPALIMLFNRHRNAGSY
ncbi:HAD-IA family hydrolase [uncultured Algimonas sp.]|uniref:HAD-IA family hydrolase n=1 Tax=uncultured Algimonas sp. TaxID=1547920 RepID=UPI0026101343|nr:HAD-IA family hydrolase [uncultured Algimonas sp.]